MSELNAVMPLETPNFGPSTGIAVGPVPTKAPAQTAPEPIEERPAPTVIEVAAMPAPVAPKPKPVDAALPVTRQELEDLKEQINDSFGEVANLLLDIQSRYETLEGRIAQYNSRSSHKI
jgi:hypothetical protein